jgi:peptide deformylase
MAILPIYTYGSAILRQKAKPIERVNDEIIKLIVDMFDTMRKASGIGLAATQVGRTERVFVVDVSDIEELKDVKPIAMINPVIVAREGVCTMEEGCLSIPDVRDEVERAESITVRYRDTNFNEVELLAGGMLARVILHELDHLDGILFLDRISAAKRKLHKERLKDIQQGQFEVTYPVVTASEVTA